MKKLRAVALFLAVLETPAGFSQAGDLDLSFGGNGVQATDLNEAGDSWNAVAVLPDGGILVCGWPLPYVAKYHVDGTIDTSFGNNGIVVIDIGVAASTNALAVQDDGRIVVAGTSINGSGFGDITVFRLLPNGDLDLSFGSGGYVTTYIQSPTSSSLAHDVAIQPDGKIVVVGDGYGESELCILRYDTTGVLDPSFDQDGVAEFPSIDAGRCVALQTDGRILAGGYTYLFELVRVNADGSPDPSFGGDGIVETAFGGVAAAGQDLVIQDDGRVILAGWSVSSGSDYDFAIARYNVDGSLDDAFGTDGRVLTGFAPSSTDVGSSICLQPDGKVLLAGSTHDAAVSIGLVRYNVDGTLDPSFGNGGKIMTDLGVGGSVAHGMALQPDGKILVAGDSCSSAAVLVRYLNDLGVGLLDPGFVQNSVFIYPQPLGTISTLTYSLSGEALLSLQIRDATGRLVRTIFSSALRARGEHRETLDLSGLVPGGYMLVLRSSQGSMTVRVIKE